MKSLFKGLMSAMSVKILTHYRQLSTQLVRIEAAKFYLHSVRMVRLVTICRMQADLLVGLICLGMLLFHAGLFILLPWTVKAKAILGLGVGLTYLLCGGILLRVITDEKIWMEKSGAMRLLNEAIEANTEAT